MALPLVNGGSGSSRANPLTLLTDLSQRVARIAGHERMFRRTRKILVATSGGADSTAALLLMLNLRERFGFEVIACHFDHQLREGSKADTEAVSELCSALGVQCFTGEGDVRGVARQQRQGLELTARTMRYEFLGFVAGKELADAVVTGHTADDQAETVLMRIIRGSGIRGIRGILPVSGVPGSEAQRLVRPLLHVTRAETVALCDEAGIRPLVDPTNDDVTFTRNRVRRETLAALRQVNPSVGRALAGLAESARELFEPVEKEVMGLAPTARTPAGSVFGTGEVAALAGEGLTLLLEREGEFHKVVPEVNRTRIENLRDVLVRGSGRVRFGEAEVEASAGRVRVGPVLDVPAAFEPVVLNVPGSTRVGSWRVDVSAEEFEPDARGAMLVFSASGQRGALRARALLRSDRMHYRGHDRKVSDILAALRTPRWERDGLVAVADSQRILGLLGATVAFAGPAGESDSLYARMMELPPR